MNKRKESFAGGHFSGAFPLEKLRTVRPMIGYTIVYLLSFMLIEQWNRLHYTVIHTNVDDMIPFSPVFVIPYMLWFPYVTVFCVFLLLKNEEFYHRLCTTLVIGMTIFIVVSIIFPNIHLLRPETMPADNVFTRMISRLYRIDTPTNLTPSIHVFNSLAIIAAAWEWNWHTDDGHVYSNPVRRFWRAVITVIGILITLSTMLIKQHSFSDVVIAIGLFLFTHLLVYRFDFVFIGGRRRMRRPVLRPRSARS
jgi:membrane-associated phospholipid phosphatase